MISTFDNGETSSQGCRGGWQKELSPPPAFHLEEYEGKNAFLWENFNFLLILDSALKGLR